MVLHRDGIQIHRDGTQACWKVYRDGIWRQHTGMVHRCIRLEHRNGLQGWCVLGWHARTAHRQAGMGCGYTRRDCGDGMQGWYIRGWFTGIVHMDAGVVRRDGPQAMCTEIDSV